MQTLRLFVLVLEAGAIAEQCFSDSFGWSDGFCLTDHYNKMVVPRDEATNISLVYFTAITLKDAYQFNNEDDTIQVRLFIWLTWIDPRIKYPKIPIKGRTSNNFQAAQKVL